MTLPSTPLPSALMCYPVSGYGLDFANEQEHVNKVQGRTQNPSDPSPERRGTEGVQMTALTGAAWSWLSLQLSDMRVEGQATDCAGHFQRFSAL